MNVRSPEYRNEGGLDYHKLVHEVVRDAVIEHDPQNPDRLSFLLFYGSKQLTCYIDKAGGKAGAVIEQTDARLKKEKETTILYRALLGMFQGVANKLLQPVEYTLITENKNLIDWAQTTGDGIFHWIGIEEQGEMKGFRCLVYPVFDQGKIQEKQRSLTARRLVWEQREEFKNQSVEA